MSFVKIQKGAFECLVLPHNIDKVEAALAKLEKPVKRDPFKRTRYDNARAFPNYQPGMSTADYVRKFEADNRILITKDVYTLTGSHPLNCQPAAQYDPNVPLCVEDVNPDYMPGVDDAPVKAKRTRKAAKAAPDKAAVMWLLMDSGLTYYQANPLADKLISLFEGV